MMIFAPCSRREAVMLIAPEAEMHKCLGRSNENRRHKVTIWISLLWMSEKMTADGIRTHAGNQGCQNPGGGDVFPPII